MGSGGTGSGGTGRRKDPLPPKLGKSDLIFEQNFLTGDIGREMFIVKRGKLNVVSEDGSEILATLSEGAVFGELCILNVAGIEKKTELEIFRVPFAFRGFG